MDDIESCLLIGMGFVVLVAWARWYSSFAFVRSMISPRIDRIPLIWLPIVCLGLLYFILTKFASFDVQTNFTYLSFYTVMGAAWIGVAISFMPFLGIIPRDDVVERRNRAALFGVIGALVGLTFCFSGGNIGDGPGWWAVVTSAGYATAAFFLLWFLLEMLSGVSQIVTVERDVAAGLRLCGFLIAIGLILGRAAAGDWFSPGQMWTDFSSRAWPALIVVAVAAVLERACRPTVEQPVTPAFFYGLVPGILYVIGGVLVLIWAGPVR